MEMSKSAGMEAERNRQLRYNPVRDAGLVPIAHYGFRPEWIPEDAKVFIRDDLGNVYFQADQYRWREEVPVYLADPETPMSSKQPPSQQELLNKAMRWNMVAILAISAMILINLAKLFGLIKA